MCIILFYALILGANEVYSADSIADISTDYKVLFIARNSQDIHRDIINHVRTTLPQSIQQNITYLLTEKIPAEHVKDSSTQLIITIGTDVTQEIVSLQPNSSIFAAAIPKLSFDELSQRFSKADTRDKQQTMSAIFLDQPLERQFNLVKHILPNAKTIAVALGPGTEKDQPYIIQQARNLNLSTQIGVVTQQEELISTLDRLLEKSDVFMGIVDPLVFNRYSASNVLLTAYRWKVPLFGISPAYVRAGALAAVYSTPSQIGEQLSQTIISLQATHYKSIPSPSYPQLFSVAVNYQVAASMGIHVATEDNILKNLLQSGGESSP